MIYAVCVYRLPKRTLVYVCLCNGITENQIREAVSNGAVSLNDLGAALGVATSCGCCAECAQQVIRESVVTSNPSLASLQAA